jgi:hypothetical protein
MDYDDLIQCIGKLWKYSEFDNIYVIVLSHNDIKRYV